MYKNTIKVAVSYLMDDLVYHFVKTPSTVKVYYYPWGDEKLKVSIGYWQIRSQRFVRTKQPLYWQQAKDVIDNILQMWKHDANGTWPDNQLQALYDCYKITEYNLDKNIFTEVQ